jgi:ketosteroid isomerase-like protein
MTQPSMRRFFEALEISSETADVTALVNLFADSLVVASANGAQVVRASDLARMIPKRKEMLEAAGCQAAKLVSLNETRLDDYYSMVRTEWRWRVANRGNESQEITLPSTYIVRRSNEGLKIVFYLAHGDITAVLRERGLL